MDEFAYHRAMFTWVRIRPSYLAWRRENSRLQREAAAEADASAVTRHGVELTAGGSTGVLSEERPEAVDDPAPRQRPPGRVLPWRRRDTR